MSRDYVVSGAIALCTFGAGFFIIDRILKYCTQRTVDAEFSIGAMTNASPVDVMMTETSLNAILIDQHTLSVHEKTKTALLYYVGPFSILCGLPCIVLFHETGYKFLFVVGIIPIVTGIYIAYKVNYTFLSFNQIREADNELEKQKLEQFATLLEN